jgi:hypothetical protein
MKVRKTAMAGARKTHPARSSSTAIGLRLRIVAAAAATIPPLDSGFAQVSGAERDSELPIALRD